MIKNKGSERQENLEKKKTAITEMRLKEQVRRICTEKNKNTVFETELS